MLEEYRLLRWFLLITIIIGILIGGVVETLRNTSVEAINVNYTEGSVAVPVTKDLTETYENNLQAAKKLAEEHENRLMEEKRIEEERKVEDSKRELESTLKKRNENVSDMPATSRNSPRNSNLKEFVVTAYDLSKDSCGKVPGDKYYGITSTGADLRGKTREDAMVIASDPKVIPMGTRVEVIFSDEKYSKFNGVYTSRDTGGAIKGFKIDIFMGDFDSIKSHPSVWEFGKTKAKIRIIK